MSLSESLISSIFATLIKQVLHHDVEATKNHFKDIKDQVIRPLLHVYEDNGRRELYSIEQLSRIGLPIHIGQNIAKFNKLLFEDFLNNHYTWFKKYWEEVYRLAADAKDLDFKITERISDLAKSELKTMNIAFSERNKPDFHVVYLSVFVNCLKVMITESSYDHNKMYYSEDREAIILDNNIVYNYSKVDNPDDLIGKLQIVCNSIQCNNEVQDMVVKYNQLLSENEFKRNNLFLDLNKILICQSLKLEKYHLLWDKCEYIKPIRRS